MLDPAVVEDTRLVEAFRFFRQNRRVALFLEPDTAQVAGLENDELIVNAPAVDPARTIAVQSASVGLEEAAMDDGVIDVAVHVVEWNQWTNILHGPAEILPRPRRSVAGAQPLVGRALLRTRTRSRSRTRPLVKIHRTIVYGYVYRSAVDVYVSSTICQICG